jgi:hypothetical protein
VTRTTSSFIAWPSFVRPTTVRSMLETVHRMTRASFDSRVNRVSSSIESGRRPDSDGR